MHIVISNLGCKRGQKNGNLYEGFSYSFIKLSYEGRRFKTDKGESASNMYKLNTLSAGKDFRSSLSTSANTNGITLT